MSTYNHHARSRRLVSSAALLGILGLLVTLFAVFTTPAFASKEYVYSTSFGGPCTGSGGTCEPGQLEEPLGVAVNEATDALTEPAAGDVYVADRGNNRVERFGATGTYLGQFEAPTEGFSSPESIAVDNSGNPLDPSAYDVYVVNMGHDSVDKFNPEGKFLGAITESSAGTPFEELGGVAVDQAGTLRVNQRESNKEVFSFSDTEPNVFNPSATVSLNNKQRVEDGPGFAVDSKGDFYVVKNAAAGAVVELNGEGGEIRAPQESTAASGVAVDLSNDDAYVDNLHSIAILSQEGATLETFGSKQLEDETGSGIAVNASTSTAAVYVADREANDVKAFDDVVFPSVATGSASEVGETTVVLNGTINPEGETLTGCEFEYTTDEAFKQSKSVEAKELKLAGEAGQRARSASSKAKQYRTEGRSERATEEEEVAKAEEEQAQADEATALEQKEGYESGAVVQCETTPSGSEPQAVTASVTGLETRSTYHYRLTAETAHAARHGADQSVFTVSRPLVENESVSNITSGEATVGAQIDAAGLSTSYNVEYGTSPAYGSSSAEVPLGAPQTSTGVVVHLRGLAPGTKYYFRFVAVNALGRGEGTEEATFSTPLSSAASTSTLPDNRAYELLSTSPTIGELYVPISARYADSGDGDSGQLTRRPFQAAVNGNSIAYVAYPSPTGGSGGISGGLGTEWLATRAQGGWQSADITPVGANANAQYQGFSNDLSAGIEVNEQVLAPGALSPPCKNLYARTTGSGSYSALFTQAPDGCGNPYFAGATEDFSQVLFQSEAPLTPEAEETETPETPGTSERGHSYLGEECQLSCNLYDAAAGQLRLINILPGGGAPVPNATFGGASVEGPPDFSNVISNSGAAVFWTDTQPGSDMDHVYMRENPSQPESPHGIADECTVPADACTVAVSAGVAEYWTSTPDGRYAFYTENGELWRFDTSAEPESESHKALASTGLNGENAGVLGVIGTNQTGADGAYIYFVATGVLTTGSNARGEHAELGRDNLYVSEPDPENEGRSKITFIGMLAAHDDTVAASSVQYNGVSYGDWQPGLGERTAEVTPDGRRLVFESQEPLTGYNNRNISTHFLDEEVFVYSAEEAITRCASCDPEGRPSTVGEGGAGEEPVPLLPVTLSGTRSMRWISADGNRVFFESDQGLVPQDSNGVQDVYEWERAAPAASVEDSCTESSASFSSLDGGCVSVLSGGEGSDFSYLAEADAEGNNVFIVTRAQLSPQDRDDKLDLYDVRVDGGFPESSLACTGTGCQGAPPAPPSFATPSSVTFAGAGNFAPAGPQVKPKSAAQLKAEKLTKALKACRSKRDKQKRKACEARARKRYGPPVRSAKKPTKKNTDKGKR
jgi:hypothetical protein